ncbi:MAG: SurA N-terminal domain-containing protein [Patescibacteria group bacterium]|nr:SurA N-terminal domain-containing protein [bacterium]MDZ4221268.1 SurA N-terminal domain-containing protein [Patescibacteria group bacterium]
MEEQNTDPLQGAAPSQSKGLPIKLIASAVVLIVAGFLLWYFGGLDSIIGGGGTPEQAENQEQTEVVARVNGDEILRATYEQRLDQTNAQYQQDGFDPNREDVAAQIQDQVIQNLVNELLLMQNAAAAGISLSQEEIGAEYANLAAQYGGEQELEAAISQQGISRSQLESEISRQLTIERYLSQEVDTEGIAVTDEEAQAAYDEIASNQEDAPPFADVAENLKEQMRQQKVSQLVSDFIAALREQSDIEVLL